MFVSQCVLKVFKMLQVEESTGLVSNTRREINNDQVCCILAILTLLFQSNGTATTGIRSYGYFISVYAWVALGQPFYAVLHCLLLFQMQCQGRRTPSMKASYVAMTKGNSTDLTKDFIKQEYPSYSQPSTPVVSSDGGQGRSQRQKK